MVRAERLILRTTTRAIKDVISEDLVQTTKSRDKLNLDDKMGFKVALATRVKIMKTLLDCFNLLDDDNYIDVLPQLHLLHKRVNLHLNQLNRIDKVKYRISKKYFCDMVYMVYKYIACLKKMQLLTSTDRATTSTFNIATDMKGISTVG